jgi:hypothetical protein
MNGFKKWLEDLNRREEDPDATAVWVDKAQSGGRTDQMVSRHAQNTTPGGGTASTVSNTPHEWEAEDATLIQKISLLISPPDPRRYPQYAGKPGLDGALLDRRKDGKARVDAQGTPGYMSPEEARKRFNVTYEHDADSMETLLDMCADLFVWLDKPCRSLAKLWLNFRQFLHMNESSKPHVVNYQTNIMRMKDAYKIFPQVDELVQKCKDSDKHADLIEAWNKFYAGWEKLAPTLKHYLVTFEKNTARR